MPDIKHIVCNKCEDLKQINCQYVCGITLCKIDNIKDKPSWCPRNRNCHEYCRLAKYCRYIEGGTGINPEDCAMLCKIEDILADAREIEMEQRRALKEYDDDDDWE